MKKGEISKATQKKTKFQKQNKKGEIPRKKNEKKLDKCYHFLNMCAFRSDHCPLRKAKK